MNKRTYNKIVKRILNYSTTAQLTPLETQALRKFNHKCGIAANYILEFFEIEDEYYEYKNHNNQ